MWNDEVAEIELDRRVFEYKRNSCLEKKMKYYKSRVNLYNAGSLSVAHLARVLRKLVYGTRRAKK